MSLSGVTSLLSGTSFCELYTILICGITEVVVPNHRHFCVLFLKASSHNRITNLGATVPHMHAHIHIPNADTLPVTGAFRPACLAGWKCHYHRSHFWPSHNAAFERLNVSTQSVCMRIRARVHVCGGRGGIPESTVILADRHFNLPTNEGTLSTPCSLLC